jgi:hypothetical protein
MHSTISTRVLAHTYGWRLQPSSTAAFNC